MKPNSRLLIILLAFGLLLRALYLGSREIWYDDAFSILLSEKNFTSIIHGTAADTMPPLYYFLLHIWMAAGESLLWIRLLNVLLSLGVVWLLYRVTADLFGAQAGLWAAALTAISPFQIYHAQEVRMYSLLALALLGYTWCFIRLWLNEKDPKGFLAKPDGGPQEQHAQRTPGLFRRTLESVPDRWNWAGLALFGTAALYTHNLAAFTLVVPDVYLLLQRQWRLLGKLAAAQALMGLLFVPWLVFVPGQVSKIQTAFWTPRPGLVELIQAVIQFNATLPLPGVWMIAAAVLSFLILTVVLIESLRKDERSAGMGLLAAFALAPPILLFAASYLMRPVFVPRGMILSSLAYYAIAGVVIARSWRKGIGVILAALFAVAALISLPYQYTYNEFPRSPYRQATAYLEAAGQPGGMVVHDNKLSYFPMHFFDTALPQRFIADPPGTHNDTLALESQEAMNLFAEPDLSQAAGDSRQVYFVVFTEAIQEYQRQGEANHPSLAWLQAHYQQVDRKVFNDLEVYSFERLDAPQAGEGANQ